MAHDCDLTTGNLVLIDIAGLKVFVEPLEACRIEAGCVGIDLHVRPPGR